MVKRQTTLKKKIAKRQTRKFSKKGGRKTVKKSSRKQRKSKGGNNQPIMEEIMNNNEEALRARFDSKGITKTAINDSNINELIKFAIKKNKTSITEFLLTNGTAKNLNIQKNEFLRSIDKSTDIEIVTKLVDDSNKQDAFMIACEKGNKNAVEMLLTKGVDIENSEKEKPLMVAIQNGHKDIVESLLNEGASIDITSRHGNPVIIVATQVAPKTTKDISIIQFLVEKGADINAKDNEGNTALDKTEQITAINNMTGPDGYPGVIAKYLQENGAKSSNELKE